MGIGLILKCNCEADKKIYRQLYIAVKKIKSFYFFYIFSIFFIKLTISQWTDDKATTFCYLYPQQQQQPNCFEWIRTKFCKNRQKILLLL